MHDEPREKLCELIVEYGRSLCNDPRRCEALLKDYCGQYRREIFALMTAQKSRVAEELLKAPTGVPHSLILGRLNKRLEEDFGLSEIVAQWAVASWALALGVIEKPLSLPIIPTLSSEIRSKMSAVTDKDNEYTIKQKPTPEETIRAKETLKKKGIDYTGDIFLEKAKEGNTEIVKLLIAAGVDINTKINNGFNNGRTALMLASWKGHMETAKILMAHGAEINVKSNNGQTALMLASWKGHTEVVEFLLAHGANIETRSSKASASGWTPLMLASYEGHTETVKALIKHGAEINAKTNRSLQTALMLSSKAEITEILIIYGASVNEKDHEGKTAIMYISERDHSESVKILLAHGANIEAKDNDGRTTLIRASTGYRCKGVVETLLAHGANIEAKDNDGQTALIRVSKQGYSDKGVVETLLAHGANIEAKDNDGRTALIWASTNGHTATVQNLLAHGANIEASETPTAEW